MRFKISGVSGKLPCYQSSQRACGLQHIIHTN